MPDLNEMVLPTVWTLARRALADRPVRSLADLVERLTPDGLIKRSSDAPAASRHVLPSVRALESMGILREGGDGAVELIDAAWTERRFRYEVARALLVLPDDADVWAIREGTGRLEHHLEVGVSWLQLQGTRPSVERWQAASELLDRQFGVDRPFLRDTAPFNTLERLAQWLGIAARSATGWRADPTPLVREALPSLLEGGAASGIDFRRRSAECFPWMPHGPIGSAVAERMQAFPDTSAVEQERLPEGLSLALIRLDAEKVIVLEGGDDTRERVLLSFDGAPERGIARIVMA